MHKTANRSIFAKNMQRPKAQNGNNKKKNLRNVRMRSFILKRLQVDCTAQSERWLSILQRAMCCKACIDSQERQTKQQQQQAASHIIRTRQNWTLRRAYMRERNDWLPPASTALNMQIAWHDLRTNVRVRAMGEWCGVSFVTLFDLMTKR